MQGSLVQHMDFVAPIEQKAPPFAAGLDDSDEN